VGVVSPIPTVARGRVSTSEHRSPYKVTVGSSPKNPHSHGRSVRIYHIPPRGAKVDRLRRVSESRYKYHVWQGPLLGLGLFHDCDVKLLKLRRVDFAWRSGHQIGGALRLGEGDDLADVRLACHEHNQPVHAGRNAAVRGRAVLERFEQVAEALARVVDLQPDQLEDLLLHLPLVDTDAPTRHFIAVAHQVVLLALNGCRVAVE